MFEIFKFYRMFYKLIFVDVNIEDIVKKFVGFECRLVIIYI